MPLVTWAAPMPNATRLAANTATAPETRVKGAGHRGTACWIAIHAIEPATKSHSSDRAGPASSRRPGSQSGSQGR